MQHARAVPRVAFGTLVSNGLISPGAILNDREGRHRARIRVDGSVEIDDLIGPIYKVGATVQNAPACNGWTFWRYETPEGLRPIDALRQTYLLVTQP